MNCIRLINRISLMFTAKWTLRTTFWFFLDNILLRSNLNFITMYLLRDFDDYLSHQTYSCIFIKISLMLPVVWKNIRLRLCTAGIEHLGQLIIVQCGMLIITKMMHMTINRLMKSPLSEWYLFFLRI